MLAHRVRGPTALAVCGCLLTGLAYTAAATAKPSRHASAGDHGILLARAGRNSPNAGDGGNIYLWRAARPLRRLTAGPDPRDWAQWSPNGTRIAFTMIPGWNGQGSCQSVSCRDEVWVMRANGTGQRRLTYEGEGGATKGACPKADAADQPSWSPDGRRLVFVCQFPGAPGFKLAVVSVRNGKEEPLHYVIGDDPVWGRRGIAYVAGGGGTATAKGVRLLNPKNGRGRWLVRAPVATGGAAALAWSPDGAELAVLETTFGRRIAIYSSSGRTLATFTSPLHSASVWGVSWSPDGTHLLLSVIPRGPHTYLEHYEVDTTGTHWRRLRLGSSTASTSWR